MKNKPNVLLIVPDQQRYDCIGYSNMYPVKTPNIDRLASEGVWFSNAYTPTPLCCPARQALLNGRRPEAFGALWNYDITLKIPALEPTEYTWTKELNEYGYKTGYVGKWHVNPEHDPTEYGFDDYVDLREYNAFREERYPKAKFIEGDRIVRRIGKDSVPVEHSRTHWLANQAISLMQKYLKKGEPWHIRLDFPEPHLPCRPAGHFANMYSPEDIPMWGSFNDEFVDKPYIQKQQLYSWGIENYTWKDWAPIVAMYYGIVSQVDDAMGKVIEKLDELGIAENTIVIYTSDHGDACGGHRMMDKHYILYDDVVRVPFIIRWPAKIKAGFKCDSFVMHFLDIPPTILEIVGLKSKDFFHGRSLLPFLEGKKVANWRKEAVSTYNGQQFGLYTQRMIRNSHWKYIWNTTDVDELYNLDEDPNELINLIHDKSYADLVTKLRRRLYEVLLHQEDGLVVKTRGDSLMANRWMKNQLLNSRKL